MPNEPVPYFMSVSPADSYDAVGDRILVQAPNGAWQRYAVSDVGELAMQRVIACPAGSRVPVGVIAQYGSKQAKLDAVRNPSPDGLVRVKPQEIGGVRSHGILVPLDDPRIAPLLRQAAHLPDEDRAATLLNMAFAVSLESEPVDFALTPRQTVLVVLHLLGIAGAIIEAVEGIAQIVGLPLPQDTKSCAS